MSNYHCSCCRPDGTESNQRESTDYSPAGDTMAELSPSERWLGHDSITDATLPPDVSQCMSEFFDTRVETLEDIFRTIRSMYGPPLDTGVLCESTQETPHVAVLDDEIIHLECFFDGIVLAVLEERPVAVRTESPTGEQLEMTVDPDGGIEQNHESAVLSLGITKDPVSLPEESSIQEAAGAAICPFVKAFESPEEYKDWASSVSAATVGLPLGTGFSLARELIGEN